MNSQEYYRVVGEDGTVLYDRCRNLEEAAAQADISVATEREVYIARVTVVPVKCYRTTVTVAVEDVESAVVS